MANQEHLEILKQFDPDELGPCAVWNKWRHNFPYIQPDLTEADLSLVTLSFGNFDGADLRGVHIGGGSAIYFAQFTSANLSGVTFNEVVFDGVNFRDANFRGAQLARTNFRWAGLKNSDFSQVQLAKASFGDVDLSGVKGLDTVNHLEPSTLGIDTIIRSQGKIPEIFLRKAGVPESIIEQIPALIGSLKTIDYYTCFISYSSKDEDFAKKLYTDLQSNGVRCWFAPEDMKIGEKFWHRIDESIKLYDKLLVVLSQHSVESEWVEREVIAAQEKERQLKKPVLFPITLDEAFKLTNAPWAADIRRSRHTGNFTQWKIHDDYQKAFDRLMRDLKAESSHRP